MCIALSCHLISFSIPGQASSNSGGFLGYKLSHLGYSILMRIYLARGEMDAARSAFQQAEEALAKIYSPYRRDVYVIVDWVQFWLVSGALDRAERWAQEVTQQARVPSPLARERQDVARVRILLARKDPTEALSLLKPLEIIAEQQERLSHLIEIKVLKALAYQMQQQEQEALNALAQAVGLAEPEGYIRIFADEGAPMAALLSRLRARKRNHRPSLYLDTLLAAFLPHDMRSEHRPEKAEHCMTGQPQRDRLSERELEVLRLLARGDSNQEIAETLVLSIDTIKRHVSNIFSKLGVHSRVQAVARATALGLLSDEPDR
jgi:LuxR family transcriptional regulator, maltose regulon positive regulatory protein